MKNLKPMTAANLMFIANDDSKVPVFKEVSNKDYVLFGERNDYPEYLIKLFNRSAKHNAIVTGKANYIYGKGWAKEGVEDEGTLANSSGETINEILIKAALDLELFNGIALECIWSNGKTKLEIYHVDFSKVRSNEDNTEFYYTSKWFLPSGSRNMTPENESDYKTFKPFDSNKRGGSQLYYFKVYRPSLGVYPLPDYIGAIPYIETDMKIAAYHLNNITKGFTGGTMFNFYNGVPTEEEQKKIQRKVNGKMTGEDGDVTLFNFADSKERGAEIIQLRPNDLDKQFLQLNDTVQQEIFTAHKVTSPMLFGVKTAGQLGGRNELIEANEIFKANYVTPRQQLVEHLFEELFPLMGIEGDYDIINLDQVGLISPEERVKVMTPNEIRVLSGLPEIETVQQPSNDAQTQMRAKLKKQIKDEENILSKFRNCGVSRKDFEIKTFTKDRTSDLEFLKQSFATLDITTVEQGVLDLLIKDKMSTVPSMAVALEVTQETILKAMEELQAKKLIIAHDNSVIPTAKGEKINDKNPPEVNLFVLYSYDELPDAPPVKTESREFCQEMMALDKLYTREEIELIANETGTDVWLYRGGFYHNPETDITTAWCRHVWNQNVVSKK